MTDQFPVPGSIFFVLRKVVFDKGGESLFTLILVQNFDSTVQIRIKTHFQIYRGKFCMRYIHKKLLVIVGTVNSSAARSHGICTRLLNQFYQECSGTISTISIIVLINQVNFFLTGDQDQCCAGKESN